MRKIFQQTGFTLVELLVAMAILGMLIAGILAAASIARRSGRDTVTKNNLQAVQLALEDFTGSSGKYPSWAASPCSGSTEICYNNGTSVRVGLTTVDFKSGANLVSMTNGGDPSGITSNSAYCDNAPAITQNTSTDWYIKYFTNGTARSTFALATKLENGQCFVLTTK